jgi:hypothetical protein
VLHVLQETDLATYFMHPTSQLRLGDRALVALEAGTVVREEENGMSLTVVSEPRHTTV